MSSALTVWTNAACPGEASDLFRQAVSRHTLLEAPKGEVSNLVAGKPDPALLRAEIAFGQPDPDQLIASERIRWVHLSSAGYTRYDRDDLRAALRARSAIMTNSSHVYDEPCAQHALAMMLAFARQLPGAWMSQATDRGWPYLPLRSESFLLNGQTVLMLGFGAIGRRLAELLRPFGAQVVAVRRSPSPDDIVRTAPMDAVDDLLAGADHVVNLLPAAVSTDKFMDARRFGRMKAGSFFYNIGRGDTVDQNALAEALERSHLAAAYLDVTSPEPLPPGHFLWGARNCHITPHTAGGHKGEFVRLVRYFADNLRRFEAGEPLHGRVF